MGGAYKSYSLSAIETFQKANCAAADKKAGDKKAADKKVGDKKAAKKTAKKTARIGLEYYSEPPDAFCAARRACVDVPPWRPA